MSTSTVAQADTALPAVLKELLHRSPLCKIPTEILREIAFLSFNPNLYITCRDIYSRLNPLKHYLQDLSIVIFADRTGDPNSVWTLTPQERTDSLLWSTISAREWDLKFDQPGGLAQRHDLQKQVLRLECTTASRAIFMIRHVLQTCMKCYFPCADSLPSIQHERLGLYLDTTQAFYGDYTIRNGQGDALVFKFGKLVQMTLGGICHPSKFIVDMVAPPTHLLSSQKGSHQYKLGRMLLHRTRMDSLNHAIVKRYIASAKPTWMTG